MAWRRRRRKNVVELFGQGLVTKRKPRFKPKSKRRRFPWAATRLIMLALSIVLIARAPMTNWQAIAEGTPQSPTDGDLTCNSPYLIDGDTFDCGGERVRLASIDAPEMPGHCRQGRDCTPGDPYAARDRLSRLVQQTVTCRRTDTDRYGRPVATCTAGGVDLSCAMVASGHAVQRYGMLSC